MSFYIFLIFSCTLLDIYHVYISANVLSVLLVVFSQLHNVLVDTSHRVVM